MQTQIISPVRDADIAHAAQMIRDGALVAFPTETVYGLGANGLDAAACARIYAAKGRPSDNPLILHIADLSMAADAARTVPPAAAHLLTAFAPGPITVILPKASHVPDIVTGGLSTVGVRCPDHDIARALIRAAGVPVAAPSANTSGRPSPTTAAMGADGGRVHDCGLYGGRDRDRPAPGRRHARDDCGGTAADGGARRSRAHGGGCRAACPGHEVPTLCTARTTHRLYGRARCRDGGAPRRDSAA